MTRAFLLGILFGAIAGWALRSAFLRLLYVRRMDRIAARMGSVRTPVRRAR